MLNRQPPHQPQITRPIAYFDTVALWLRRPLKDWERDTLESLCHQVVTPYPSRASKYWMSFAGYSSQLVLQQPTRDAFTFLQGRLIIRPQINRVHCTLDFPTSTQSTARELQLYIDARFFKPYHRPIHQVVSYAGTTTYVGFKNKHSKFVTYADSVGKHHHGPCCHLEYRFQSRRAVKKHGITLLADLANFDHYGFWTKQLSLYEYDLEMLGKLYSKRHLNSAARIVGRGKWGTNVDVRTGARICRVLLDGEMTNPLLMELSDCLANRGLKIKKVLHRLDELPTLKLMAVV